MGQQRGCSEDLGLRAAEGSVQDVGGSPKDGQQRSRKRQRGIFQWIHSIWWLLPGAKWEHSEFQRLGRDSPPADDCPVGKACWDGWHAGAGAGAAPSGQDAQRPPCCSCLLIKPAAGICHQVSAVFLHWSAQVTEANHLHFQTCKINCCFQYQLH